MIIHEISSGNQGLAIKAQDADGQIAFVKVLSDKDQSNRERRGRVYREVSALRTINIAEIPKLLESNAEHHQDLSFQMYLATEFIEGPTLERHVEGSLVSPNLAVAFTVSLCETLEVAHKYGIYHRDVKPDNIIVSSRGANLVPVLVDFGMSSIKHIDEDFSTSKGQEIGNRFLRLPELSAGSENKSDPRSDVTFCVGLLFYMLTGRAPRLLADEKNQMPHQRGTIPQHLRGLALNTDRVLATFDTGFQESISRRFQSVEHLKAALNRLILPDSGEPSTEEAIGKRVRERLGTSSEQKKVANMKWMEDVVTRVGAILYRLANESDHVVIVSQTGFNRFPSCVSSEYGLQLATDASKSFMASVEATMVGTEVILSLDGPGVPRCRLRMSPGTIPVGQDADVVESFYWAGMDGVTDPTKQRGIQNMRRSILEKGRPAITAMIRSMLSSVKEFIADGRSELTALDSTEREQVHEYPGTLSAQGYLLARFNRIDKYVRFNCFASVRLANHADDMEEMRSSQSITVTVMEEETGSGSEGRIGQTLESLVPFAPSRDHLQEALTQALADIETLS